MPFDPDGGIDSSILCKPIENVTRPACQIVSAFQGLGTDRDIGFLSARFSPLAGIGSGSCWQQIGSEQKRHEAGNSQPTPAARSRWSRETVSCHSSSHYRLFPVAVLAALACRR
jgi:hypothetical protein